jgi:hypothetical protein
LLLSTEIAVYVKFDDFNIFYIIILKLEITSPLIRKMQNKFNKS